MSLLKVARMGHPVLRTRAREIDRAELKQPSMQKLIDDMIDTMHEYHGVGLAAPQIHEGLRIFVAAIAPENEDPLSPDDEPMVFINPVITPAGPEMVEDWEGCLSIPDIRGRVPRARAIRVDGDGSQRRENRHRLARFSGARHPARDRSPRRGALLRSHAHVHDAVVSGGVRAILGEGKGLSKELGDF